MLWSRVAVLAAISLSAAAHAAVPQQAQSAYVAGEFIKAANVAEADGSADALAFAARARTADAVMREAGLCGPCLALAETTARSAIERNPNLADAHVQLAIAIGFRGRLLSSVEAQNEGLAEKGRAAIDRALELDPLNPWARAALGGWHLEIVRRAGPVLASALYGANERDGLASFRKAIEQDPGNMLLRYNFALSILALDIDEFRKEALSALAWNNTDPPGDAISTFTRNRARQLSQLIVSQLIAAESSDDEIEALVRRYQGYPDD